MAEIRSLDGKVLESAPERNADVGELLRRHLEQYERGEIAFMGIVITAPNGSTDCDWAWGSAAFGSFPWAIAQIGALESLLSDLHAAARESQNRTPDTGAPTDAS